MRALAIIAFAVVFFVSAGLQSSDLRADARIVLIDGNCAGGKPLGEISWYTTKLRIKKNGLGYARIRSRAFFDSANDNVIGTVRCGTILWGEGPLKDGETSAGIGYAVAIRDSLGNIRRGYISYTVVEVIH